MEPSSWKGNWSRFWKRVATEDVTIGETPELYLKLTTKCMKRMNKMLSSATKINQEQCKYLANKLDVALTSAYSIKEKINTWYSSSTSPEDMSGCLEIFKLLLLMGFEAEDFIQNCYKDGWIQSAFMLANVSERIGSIGFNLEFCSIIFLERKLERLKSFTILEIENLHQIEASIVKEKANLDEMKLLVDLGNVTQLCMQNSTEWQLATFLLGRLKSARLQPGVGLLTSYEFIHSKLSMKTLKTMEVLGKGASAIVYRSNWLEVEVAKKTFYGPSNPAFLQEVSILARLSHPNVVSLLWYMIDQHKSHIIMELMDGDLHTLMQSRLEKNGNHGYPFSILEALDLMLQTAEGMFFLHEMKILHRDLKSSNILVKCGKTVESDFEYVQAKVADFGLSKINELSMTYSQQTLNMGTPRWMAPEMIVLGYDDGQVEKVALKYPFKCDVYSFGIVCFEILTGDLPFATITNREVKKVVLSGGRPQLPDECPNKLKTLIEACWNPEASSRPHFGDICAELRHLKCTHLTYVWAKVPQSFSLDEINKMTNEFNGGLELDKCESFVDEENQTCDSSSSSPNNPFSEALYNELKKIDNISEVSSNHEDLQSLLHGDGTIIFCCYDVRDNHFEFYFKDSIDMESVAGVGLQYAKVILVEGWKVRIQEISEMEWKHTLERARSSSTIVYKSLKLEPSPVDKEFKGYLHLWNLAKYFALKETISTFTMVNTRSASSSKGSSGAEIAQANGGGNEELAKAFSMWYLDMKGKRREKDDGENVENGRDPYDPKDAIHKNLDTTVSIELLAGGKIEDAVVIVLDENKKVKKKYNTPKADEFELEAKEKLKVLNNTIRPSLEFTFSNQDGCKKIQCTVGNICFILDTEEKWLHHGLQVKFGLCDTDQNYGEVVRSSFKHLDLKEGKKSGKGSRALASSEGQITGTTWDAAAKLLGFGGSSGFTETSSGTETDTRQSETGFELNSDYYTKGGLEFKEITDPDDHAIECRYYSRDHRDYEDLSKTSTLRVNQDVKFQGTFEVIEDPGQPAPHFVEYKLTASRCLEEVSPELTTRTLYKDAPKLRAGKKEELQIIFNQKYEKRILLNHTMTQLDGKSHELREQKIAHKTVFVEKGRRTEYEWRTTLGAICDPLAKP